MNTTSANPNPETLKIYNSLTRKKEVFKPLTRGYVGMYLCGPTVYNAIHLGNLRTFLFFDFARKYLANGFGYTVKFVRNITDLGHEEFESESSKIEKQARIERKDPMEIAQRYTVSFRETCRLFGIEPPNIEPLATGHLPEQIEVIKKIYQRGYAYRSKGSIYFDVEKYTREHPDTPYGTLSGNSVENLKALASQRTLKGGSDKKQTVDFALWKKAEERHIMRWNFPSDTPEISAHTGHPGWHLECTAMSQKYLGDRFDIHAGGLDLKFPHHECEIAQAFASCGRSPAQYWMHSNMLTLNGKKMSKSEGNSILPSELISPPKDKQIQIKGRFSPMVIRLFMLQSHYRSVLDITQKGLEDAQKVHQKLSSLYQKLCALPPDQNKIRRDDLNKQWVEDWVEKCFEAVNDDFNTPKLIARLLEVEKIIKAYEAVFGGSYCYDPNSEMHRRLKNTYELFFLKTLSIHEPETVSTTQITKCTQEDALILGLTRLREDARKEKNWELSDKIRDLLKIGGVSISDSKASDSLKIK